LPLLGLFFIELESLLEIELFEEEIGEERLADPGGSTD